MSKRADPGCGGLRRPQRGAVGWRGGGHPAGAGALLAQMRGRWPADAYALASRAHVRAQAGRHHQALDDARALVAAHPRRSAGDWFKLPLSLIHISEPKRPY